MYAALQQVDELIDLINLAKMVDYEKLKRYIEDFNSRYGTDLTPEDVYRISDMYTRVEEIPKVPVDVIISSARRGIKIVPAPPARSIIDVIRESFRATPRPPEVTPSIPAEARIPRPPRPPITIPRAYPPEITPPRPPEVTPPVAPSVIQPAPPEMPSGPIVVQPPVTPPKEEIQKPPAPQAPPIQRVVTPAQPEKPTITPKPTERKVVEEKTATPTPAGIPAVTRGVTRVPVMIALSYVGSLQKTPEEMFQQAYQNYRLRGYSEEEARRLAAEMTRYSTKTVIPESKQIQIAKAKEEEVKKELQKTTYIPPASPEETPEQKFSRLYENWRRQGYSPEQAKVIAANAVKYVTGKAISSEVQDQLAKSVEDKIAKETPNIAAKPPSGHKWGEPVKIMSIDEYQRMLEEYKKKGSCPLGGFPAHFVDEATGKVYFFNTVEELQAYQRKLHPELYDGTPEFEQRIKAQKASQEFDKAFQEKYGNLKAYGALTDILEQAYQEAKKVAETTGSAEEAMKKVEEIAGSKVNEFLAAHPAVSIAEGLNKGTMAITTVDSSSVIVDKTTGEVVTEVGKPVAPTPAPTVAKPAVPPLAVAIIAAGAIAGSAYYLMRKK